MLNAGSVSSCTVNDLRKFTEYEFFIVPFYKTVEGKPSNSRLAKTLEDGETYAFSTTILFSNAFLFSNSTFSITNWYGSASIELLGRLLEVESPTFGIYQW